MSCAELFEAMLELYADEREPEYMDAPDRFPLPKIYPGQQKCLSDMQAAIKTVDTISLTSHTGSGKTPVFRALIAGSSAIIIEPRKFLQKQAASYCDDFVLFGRSEYKCQYAPSAASSPCQKTETCADGMYKTLCPQSSEKCVGKKCRIFRTIKGVFQFPCKDCAYLQAQGEAQSLLKRDGAVVCNFGNFWQLLKSAKCVVVDEADLFFREISKPTRLFFSDAKKDRDATVPSLLDKEHKGLSKALESASSSEYYKIRNSLYTITFLEEYQDLCFRYQRKDRIYIEVSPENVGVLKDKLFKDKKVVLVSATLGNIKSLQFSYSIFQRRGIFFAPVGKMTSRELATKPFLMDRAAESIIEISSIAEGLFDTHKFPVHCGNLTTHAPALLEKLGEDNCILHSRGNLMHTIDRFNEEDVRYLLIAGADYGADFPPDVKVQFVLKFPYASLDERMRTLERLMGPERFNKYYTNEAISRIVQQSGRVCRGFGAFGATIILDAKFMEVYQQNKKQFPDWFRDSFDGRVY